VFVAQNLYFDVPRMREIFLDEYPAVAECCRCFARSRFQSAFELRRFRNDAHPASATTGGSFDEDRIIDLRGEIARCGNFRGLDSWHHRNASRDGDSPRCDLVAEGSHNIRPWPDKHDLSVGRRLREFGTFREKSVPRMNRVGAGLFCGCDYCRDIEIALRGLSRPDRDRLVSSTDVRAVRVRRRIDGDSLEAEHARAADDPKRYLAAICDQQFFEPPCHRIVEASTINCNRRARRIIPDDAPAHRIRMNRYFEDFTAGQTFKHWPGRTITDFDNTWFTLMTMNTNPIHFDAAYAATTQHGRPLVNGLLVMATVVGMSVKDVSENAIANLEYESVRHTGPTFAGDTLYAETTVLETTASKSKSDRGVIYVETRGLNQRGEEIMILRRKILIPRRPA
jgi:itaconyl-CoA hydratase